MKLARPEPEHSLLLLWLVLLCVSERGIVIAREQEKQMSRNIGCTPRLNQFVSERDVSPRVSKLLCIKTIGKQTQQNGSW